MPVLLDCTSTPVRVRRSVPWYSLSLTSAPAAVVYRYGATTSDDGVARPASSRAAAVTVFIVDPGSNGAVKAREPSAAASFEAGAVTSFGATGGPAAAGR